MLGAAKPGPPPDRALAFVSVRRDLMTKLEAATRAQSCPELEGCVVEV